MQKPGDIESTQVVKGKSKAKAKGGKKGAKGQKKSNPASAAPCRTNQARAVKKGGQACRF
jgi:hypothetical protein